MIRNIVSLALQLLVLSALGFAQGVATGDLHVIVRDPKGSLVTNATVSAQEQAKAYARSTTANSEGEYRILALPPGGLAGPAFGPAGKSGRR